MEFKLIYKLQRNKTRPEPEPGAGPELGQNSGSIKTLLRHSCRKVVHESVRADVCGPFPWKRESELIGYESVRQIDIQVNFIHNKRTTCQFELKLYASKRR